MRRRDESPLIEDMYEAFKRLPVWVGPAAAVAIFCFFRFLLPLFFVGSTMQSSLRPMLELVAWALGLSCLVAWVAAEMHKLIHRRPLVGGSRIVSVRRLSWREFETLIAEAYRRRGYDARVVGSDAGDGGVDVRLTGQGEVVLVQCKHWRAYKVGVRTVRELLGVVVSENADRGILVTSGRFTAEAERFAQNNPHLELVDGTRLPDLLDSPAGQSRAFPVVPLPAARNAQPGERCPVCGAAMVLRTARKGANAGSRFWGCSNYPACRGIRPFAEASNVSPGT